MRALLLAAGLGTRLRPITECVPKCLVLIKGRPLLNIWIDSLIKSGVKEILINTHYLHEQVREHIELSNYAANILLSNEINLLGTGGSIIKNIDFFNNEDALIIHADNYCQENMNEFYNAHLKRPNNCLMTMMTFRCKDPSSCGIVEINTSGVVEKFHEKVLNPPGNLANGAVYILSPEMLKLLRKNFLNAEEFTIDIISKFTQRIYTYEAKKLFIDIGTPEAYMLVNN